MSEYERGRRDMEKLRDEWARRAKEFMALATKGDALWERSLTYTTVVEEVDALLAATSGTPAEHNPARAPHNKFASLWCDACPRPASGTPATTPTPPVEQLIEAARLIDLLSHEDGRPADGFRFREGIQLMRDALIQLGRAPYQAERVAQAAAPGGKEPKMTPLEQVRAKDIARELIELDGEPPNEAGQVISQEPIKIELRSLEEATESVSKWPAWKREYSEQHPFLTSQDPKSATQPGQAPSEEPPIESTMSIQKACETIAEKEIKKWYSHSEGARAAHNIWSKIRALAARPKEQPK